LTLSAQHASGIIRFSTGAVTERVRIDATGNVGIGTTSPATKLDVNMGTVSSNTTNFGYNVYADATGNIGYAGYNLQLNNSTANSTAYVRLARGSGSVFIGMEIAAQSQNGIRFLTDSTTPAERMRIDNSGNLGIGTTSPAAKLDISYASGTTPFPLNIQDETGYGIYVHSNNTLNFNYGINATSVGYINFQGYQGGVTQFRDTHIGNGKQAVVAYFDGVNGRVGIGTTSPAGLLEIYSSQNSYPISSPMLKINNTSSTGQSALDFYINSTFRGRVRSDYAGNLSYAVNGGGHYFYTGGDSGTGGVAVTITGTALAVTGALSKGSGSFRIEHPLPALTETHNLVHSFIEGPKCDLIYRGSVTLVAGTATINIDTDSTMTEGTFEVLCRNVQCFTTNESDWTSVKGSVSRNILTITANDNTSTATVSWMVIGQRKDPHIISTNWTDEQGDVIVEPLKEVTSFAAK
jgi:hypothetical protein